MFLLINKFVYLFHLSEKNFKINNNKENLWQFINIHLLYFGQTVFDIFEQNFKAIENDQSLSELFANNGQWDPKVFELNKKIEYCNEFLICSNNQETSSINIIDKSKDINYQ